jgi:hypothetical protein
MFGTYATVIDPVLLQGAVQQGLGCTNKIYNM